jgi:hypothetical protein
MSKQVLLYDKSPLTKKRKNTKDKKKKPKQKQKQKQTVKQNVEVKVQSSGGSSGGGGGFIPSPFQDRTGENVRIQNLIDTIQKQQQKQQQQAKAPEPAPRAPEPEPLYRASIPRPDIYPNIFDIPGFPTPTFIQRKPNTDSRSLYEKIVDDNKKIQDDLNELDKDEEEFMREQAEQYRREEEADKKKAPRSDKGKARGSTKQKYLDIGIEEGIPLGRDIQNEYVMAVEQKQDRALQPGQMRLMPTAEEQPASSSSDILFA